MDNTKTNVNEVNLGGEYNVAVIGATGNVGSMVMDYLHDRSFSVKTIQAFASSRSAGKPVHFGDDNIIDVRDIKEINFKDIDIVFFCAGSEIAKKYAREAASNNCIVIDKSSYFRLDDEVPLIVPESNIKALGDAIDKIKDSNSENGPSQLPGIIISNPNCCAIPLSVALKPLDNAAKIKRLVISTYQSASGAGKAAMDELYNQTKAKYIFEDIAPDVFPTQIAFNLFPHIGDFMEDGLTDEEYKIEQELSKIIGNHIGVTVTCVRVPVFVSHSMSVNVEFEDSLTPEEAYEILSETDGVLVNSHENEEKYVTPVDATDSEEVFISRIREDKSRPSTLNLWVAADNLRKGAALNALQIAEEAIKMVK